ncbi:hypothetical protein GCM10020331_006180 [Ectobacillus funiculus]
MKNGQAKVQGDTYIPGVPGPGSPIYLSFFTTQMVQLLEKLLPTGNVLDCIETSIGKK